MVVDFPTDIVIDQKYLDIFLNISFKGEMILCFIPSFLLLECGHEGWNPGGSLVREMALEMEPIKKGQQDGKVSVARWKGGVRL